MTNFIPNLQLPFVAMAPMAGITDSAFRQLCRHFGADLLWTEMVSATGLFFKRKKIEKWIGYEAEHRTKNIEQSYGIFRDVDYEQVVEVVGEKVSGEVNILRYTSIEQPLIVQLFGKVPEHFEEAAKLVARMGFAGIDINMGCPAHKVVNSFHGCSLMRDEGLAREIVEATKEGVRQHSSASVRQIPISVKIRSGWDEVIAPRFAQVIEDAGVDFITVHARTKKQGFKGKADWEIIRQVVETVDIPVIGNGDVVDRESAQAMLEQTGCTGVMVGRAAKGQPWIFEEIREKIHRYTETGYAKSEYRNSKSETNSKYEIKNSKQIPNSKFEILNSIFDPFGHFDDPILDTAYEHCRLLVQMKGEGRGMREARKHLAWYIKGFPGAAELRARLVRVERLEQVRDIFSMI